MGTNGHTSSPDVSDAGSVLIRRSSITTLRRASSASVGVGLEPAYLDHQLQGRAI